MQRCQLGDRTGKHAHAFVGRVQRQFARDRHLLVERHAGKRDAVAPADLNAPTVGRVAECLRCVEVAVPHPLFLARVGRELPAVELAEQISPVGRVEHPARFARLAHDRQLEEIRALEEALDAALERPFLQVGR